MSQIVRHVFTPTIKRLSRKDRTIEFMGTLETPDRTGDIVRADGVELENFGKNPVFLWNHNTNIPAIGRIESVTRSGDGLLFNVKFAPSDVSEFADQIFKSFAEGFLSAVSIGFIPKDIEPIFSNDGILLGLDIRRSELLELSAVNIPAHQDALAASIDQKFQKWLDDYGTKDGALQLSDYRKTLEDTFTEEECDMKKLEEVQADVDALTTKVDEQADTLKSLVSLKEIVDLSKATMDTLNKSIVSLLEKNAGSVGAGSTPQAPTADPSALLKTLDGILSRFNERAFQPKGDK